MANPLAKARIFWKQQQFEKALQAMGEAVRQTPDDPRLLIEAGRSYGHRYQVERSLELLKKACRLGKDQYAIQHAAGESYLQLGKVDEAAGCFGRACQLAGHPQSNLQLAAICERQHQLDEADDLLAQTLAAEPGLGPALILQARIARRRGEMTRAESVLQAVITAGRAPTELLAEAWGELATLLDATEQHSDAWDAALRCKSHLLPLAQPQQEAATFVLNRCRRMVDTLTPAHFQRWTTASPEANSGLNPEGIASKRVALLTGFPRAGTTLLQRVLDAHPQIVSTEERDVLATVVLPNLGKGLPADSPIEQLLDDLTRDEIELNRAFYLSAMESLQPGPIEDRLHIDKNPSMTLMIPAMVRLFPELKLILAIRDPRDTVLSCFLRYLPLNPVSVCFLTLESTVERYLLDMGAWLKMREQLTSSWVEVRYEETVSDLQQTAQHVLAGLDLPWREEVLDYRQTQKSPVRSPTYEAVAKPIFGSSVGRWRHYQQQLAPILDKLGPLLQAYGYDQ